METDWKNTHHHPRTLNTLHGDSSSSHHSTCSTPTTVLISMTQTPSSSQATTAVMGLVTGVDDGASALLWNTLRHGTQTAILSSVSTNLQRWLLTSEKAVVLVLWKDCASLASDATSAVYLVQNAQQFPISKEPMENQSVSLAPFQVLQVHSGEHASQLEHRLV